MERVKIGGEVKELATGRYGVVVKNYEGPIFFDAHNVFWEDGSLDYFVGESQFVKTNVYISEMVEVLRILNRENQTKQ